MTYNKNRKDAKGRHLYLNEEVDSQGRYRYRYIDQNGKRREIRSWKLVPSDVVPKGKHECTSLREMENEIKKDLAIGLVPFKKRNINFDEAFNDYMETKVIRDSSRNTYLQIYNRFIKPILGSKKLGDIKYTDIKKMYIYLIKELKLKPNTLTSIDTIIHPVLEVAVRDDIIRKNPSQGVLTEVKNEFKFSKVHKEALTSQQLALFMNFLDHSKTYSHWKNIMIVLFGTGCRISELLGLRYDDISFEDNTISINHTLLHSTAKESKNKYSIGLPKTQKGIRVIPMLEEVKEALLKIKEESDTFGGNTQVIDGYSNFVFKNCNNKCLNSHQVNRAISRIVNAYNEEESRNAFTEGRNPELLPVFTAHIARHTFISQLCENNVNMKIVQEVVGHASIQTTYDVYSDISKETKVKTFEELEGKIKLS